MTERFIPLDVLARAEVFGPKSYGHLRKVAQAQHGLFKRPRFSKNLLATYPQFQKGPGNKWGCAASEYERFREEQKRIGKFVPPPVTEIVVTNRNS